MQLRHYEIEPEDLAAAVGWDEAQRALERPAAEDAPFVRWVAGAAVARGLARQHPELDVRWHAEGEEWPGLLELADASRDAERHVLVLGEPSSMEPRPVWPVRVPVDDLLSWEYDAVVWCYVPKRAPLEAADARAVGRGVTCAGWAWADEVATWKPVHLEPHPGHPFSADVWQSQVTRLQSPDTLVRSLFAEA